MADAEEGVAVISDSGEQLNSVFSETKSLNEKTMTFLSSHEDLGNNLVAPCHLRCHRFPIVYNLAPEMLSQNKYFISVDLLFDRLTPLGECRLCLGD